MATRVLLALLGLHVVLARACSTRSAVSLAAGRLDYIVSNADTPLYPEDTYCEWQLTGARSPCAPLTSAQLP